MSLETGKYQEFPTLSIAEQLVLQESYGNGVGFVFFHQFVSVEPGGVDGVPTVDLAIHEKPVFRYRGEWYVCDAEPVALGVMAVAAKSVVDAAVTTVRGIVAAAKGIENDEDQGRESGEPDGDAGGASGDDD